MTGDEALAAVRQAVATVLDVHDVGPATRLRDELRADSLALLEIIEIVEGRFAPGAPSAFHIEDEDVAGLVTVADVVDCALQRAAT